MSNIYLNRVTDSIAEIVLDKPERRNAIDLDMMLRLNELLLEAEDDSDIRVVLLKGTGDHFCSGADMKAAPAGGYTIDQKHETLAKYNRVVRTILTMGKPVISVVRGYAVGGGMSLALCCDIIFAADDAKFFGNFVKAGIVPEMGAMMILPQLIGINRAKEIWFEGEPVSGQRAYELGIANRVYPAETVGEEALKFAQKLADMPRLAMGITKRVTNSTVLSGIEALMECEQQASPFCGSTDEFKARREAFLKKKNG